MRKVADIFKELQPDQNQLIEVLDIAKEKAFEDACASGDDEASFDAYRRMHVCQGTYGQIARSGEFAEALAGIPAEIVTENGSLRLSLLVNGKDLARLMELAASAKLTLPADIKKGDFK